MTDAVAALSAAPDNTHITASLRILAEARRRLADALDRKDVLADQLRLNNAALFDEVTDAEAALARADAVARELVLAHFHATQEQKPCVGIEVVLTEQMAWADADALAWCRQTHLALIPESVDVKALKKIAKATPLPFVTVTTTPSVRIASDLDAALGVAHV